MITKLELENFKCFRSLSLDLEALTLLCGLNGMGKSSVIQSLLLLRQSLNSGDLREGRLLIGGELVDLGSGADILFEDAEEDNILFSLATEETDGSSQEFQFLFRYDRGSDLLEGLTESSTDLHGLSKDVLESLAPPIIYLQAERFGPRKILPLAESRARRFDLGTHGEYTLHVLMVHGANILPEGDPRIRAAPSRQLLDQVDAWLQDISPGSHLDITPVRAADGAIATFSFDREGDVASKGFRATNVGFGLSYVLPVIVALIAAKPGTIVLMENPEAHVHPRGQTQLGHLAAYAAAAGVQVIVETHSDHFLNGVRIAVRKGDLHPGKVTLPYFQRDGIEAGYVRPEIDTDGRLSFWPSGFFDQHEENLVQLLVPREAS